MDEGLAKIRHDRSIKDFPFLTLEDGEYVEFAFHRATICFIMIFLATSCSLIAVLLAFLVVLLNQNYLDEMGRNFMYIILATLVATAIIIGLVSARVHRGNRLFITNRRVIQFVMVTLVARSVNLIDLSSVEDASFHQDSLTQKIFKYGTFRLSTVGDETTYTFPYSDISPSELRAVSRLITESKKANKSDAAA